MTNPIPNTIRGLMIGVWLAGLIWFENRHALRAVRRSKLRRDIRNLVIAAQAAAVMQALEMPVAFKLAELAQQKSWGMLPKLHLRGVGGAVIGLLLLDYTLYWWHYLTHRVRWLWRFHQVHHLDQEMDATTALRFHFGEIAISIAFRVAQVIAIGPGPLTVAVWQVFLFLSILFHHSNVRLPIWFERKLARLVMTPRLHGIHHSIAADEVNSNWSSGFSIWDWLHGTLRTAVPQESLTLGVQGFEAGFEDTAGKSLVLPFIAEPEPPPYDRRTVREPFEAMQ